MPEEYRKLLVKLCGVEHGIEMISRSVILDFLTRVWTVGTYQAPSPFERVRTASYCWQEVGHSELLYNIAYDLDPVLANEDLPVTQYAFPMGFPTWTELAAVNFLTDRVGMYQAREWVDVNIQTGEVMEGSFPPRAMGLVREGQGLHRDKLLENWRLAELRKPLRKINPLE